MAPPGELSILLAMVSSDTGHYPGTFRLARALRARGHRVAYVGLADVEPVVRAQGFDFIVFAGDLLPVGSGARQASRLDREWLFAEYLRRIEGGQLDECLRAVKPDVLLCDTTVWYVALRALKLGIPTINLSTDLSLHANGRIPPITSWLPPGSALRTWSAWLWLRFKFFFTKRLAALLFGSFRAPGCMHHLVGVFRRVARRSGFAAREKRTYWYGEAGPRLILPEIVLCPEAFQLPGKPDDGRRYLADFVDVERREEPPDVALLDDSRPLIYCSLGGVAFVYPHARRFFTAVLAASALRGDLQFVVHVGQGGLAKLGAYPAAPNLVVRERVPQLALLRRAKLMVTHGGINSIMECVHFQVPMVIVPGRRDQPGNAVRARHHGLAVTARMAGITAAKLVELIAAALDDAGLRAGLARMQAAIAGEPGLEACVEQICAAAERPPG